jgi:hypothetical protein
MNKIKFPLITLLFILLISSVYSDEDALSIIRKVDEKQWIETSKSELSMLVFPDAGDEKTVREFTVLTYGRGTEDSYMEFLSPRSIKGLKLLSRGDDQWIFFASTGRRRKIASSSKSKKQSVRGVGGDFSYEDLGGGKLEEKYAFTIIKKSKNEWILDGKPKKEESVYSRIVVYVVKSNYLVSMIEYYTEEEGHYKDLMMEEVKRISGRETATRMVMINHEKESKTVVILLSAEYDISIDEKYFNPTRFYQ